MKNFGCFSWLVYRVNRLRRSGLHTPQPVSTNPKPDPSAPRFDISVPVIARMSKDMKKYWVGKKFDIDAKKYKVVDVIDCGRTSAVLKAICGKDFFAIKRALTQNEEDQKQLFFEIEIMEMFADCSKILNIHGHSVVDCEMETKEFFMIMPYYPGACYLNRMKTIVPEPERYSEAMMVFCDVCEALYHLHTYKTPIIHRDVKVENVLQDGKKYILCDFGSCVYEADLKNLSRSDRKENMEKYTTPSYRSPEVVVGEEITVQSDIWAMGCMLYYMCYYTMPFGDQVMSIMNANLMFPEGEVPKEIKDIIVSTLKVDPQSRPDITNLIQIAFDYSKRPVTFIKPTVDQREEDPLDARKYSSRSPGDDDAPSLTNSQFNSLDEYPSRFSTGHNSNSSREHMDRLQDHSLGHINEMQDLQDYGSYEDFDQSLHQSLNNTPVDPRLGKSVESRENMRSAVNPEPDMRSSRLPDPRRPYTYSNRDLTGPHMADSSRRNMMESSNNLSNNVPRGGSTPGSSGSRPNNLSNMDGRMNSVRGGPKGADRGREPESIDNNNPFISYLYRNKINPFLEAPFDPRNRIRVPRSAN